MAIDSFECKIISGGFYHCDSSWKKSSDELDSCFKIYNPVSGDAQINVDGREYKICPGNIYFISGFKIVSQMCSSFMDIYWLHFIPSSLYLRQVLLNSEPVRIWDKTEIPFRDKFNCYVQYLFGINKILSSNINIRPYTYEEARIQSYIMIFISDILKDSPAMNPNTSSELDKLELSINYMNSEFKQNPSLEEIASKSALAPNYFHSLFKKNFGLTPFNHMLRLRMELAIRLLNTTDKSIKEIAFETGYDNEFYFYRQFKKHYKYSPGKLRKLRPF